MTLKREIKDAYIENGDSVYIKTHSDAIYVDENETETLTKRLDDIKGKIDNNTSQLNANANEIETVKTNYAKKTEVNNLASSKAEKVDLDATNTKVNQNTQELETQKARIDTFTKLAEGSTTGDAELQDIRVKLNGETSVNAGTAIREQFAQVDKNIRNGFIDYNRKCAWTNATYSSQVEGEVLRVVAFENTARLCMTSPLPKNVEIVTINNGYEFSLLKYKIHETGLEYCGFLNAGEINPSEPEWYSKDVHLNYSEESEYYFIVIKKKDSTDISIDECVNVHLMGNLKEYRPKFSTIGKDLNGEKNIKFESVYIDNRIMNILPFKNVNHIKCSDGYSFTCVKFKNGNYISDKIVWTNELYFSKDDNTDCELYITFKKNDNAKITVSEFNENCIISTFDDEIISERKYKLNDFPYENIKIDSYEKKWLNDTKRLTYKNFIKAEGQIVKAREGYKIVCLMFYDKDVSTFTSILGEYCQEFKAPREGYFTFTIKKDDDSDILKNTGAVSIGPVTIQNYNEDSDNNDSLYKVKGNIGFATLDNTLTTYANNYIAKNGFKIGERNATLSEIKEYLLNRDNYIYRGALHKEGNRIVGADNKLVEIRGVGLHFLLQYKKLHTKECFETLKYYGVNCIRLSAYLVAQHHCLKSNNETSYGYLSKKDETIAHMDEIIQICTDLGLYVIIDWHILELDGHTSTYLKEQKEFFEYFSNKYASYGNIIYEVYNEPYMPDEDMVTNVSNVKVIRDIIRSHNRTAIIVTGRNGRWWYDVFYAEMKRQGYDDVFISSHAYVKSDDVPLDETGLLASYPIFPTEWGNAEASGDGATNDEAARTLLENRHNLCVPHCIWKFTYQNMTSSLLKYSDEAWYENLFKYGGFVDKDLSHNGLLFLKAFQEYAFGDKHIDR